MREIPHDEFLARYAAGLELIDVREPYEYAVCRRARTWGAVDSDEPVDATCARIAA
jgi:hypothetical protein